MRTLLLQRLAPLLALLALAATSCGTVDSPALSVNGEEISVDAVQEELKIIRENRAYREALEQAYQTELAGEGKGTFSAAFTAQVLSLQVYYELLEQALADEGARLTDADIEEARETVEQQLSSLGEGVLDRFPKKYRDRLARQEAVVAVAAEHAAGNAESEEVELACVSHILITTEARPEAEAKRLIDEIKAEIGAGADFAEVARARSEDPGSKEAGGDLGCGPAGRFVPEFDDAAFSQPVGEVGEPVKTDFGYHLLLVTSRELGEDPAGADGQAALNEFVSEVVCDDDAEIDVNPRYGRWDRSPCDEGGLASVTPPRTVGGE